MLEEEFETWPPEFLPDVILITVGIHVSNLCYLKDKPCCFTELLNDNIEELNKMLVRLDTAAVIPKTDD